MRRTRTLAMAAQGDGRLCDPVSVLSYDVMHYLLLNHLPGIRLPQNEVTDTLEAECGGNVPRHLRGVQMMNNQLAGILSQVSKDWCKVVDGLRPHFCFVPTDPEAQERVMFLHGHVLTNWRPPIKPFSSNTIVTWVSDQGEQANSLCDLVTRGCTVVYSGVEVDRANMYLPREPSGANCFVALGDSKLIEEGVLAQIKNLPKDVRIGTLVLHTPQTHLSLQNTTFGPVRPIVVASDDTTNKDGDSSAVRVERLVLLHTSAKGTECPCPVTLSPAFGSLEVLVLDRVGTVSMQMLVAILALMPNLVNFEIKNSKLGERALHAFHAHMESRTENMPVSPCPGSSTTSCGCAVLCGIYVGSKCTFKGAAKRLKLLTLSFTNDVPSLLFPFVLDMAPALKELYMYCRTLIGTVTAACPNAEQHGLDTLVLQGGMAIKNPNSALVLDGRVPYLTKLAVVKPYRGTVARPSLLSSMDGELHFPQLRTLHVDAIPNEDSSATLAKFGPSLRNISDLYIGLDPAPHKNVSVEQRMEKVMKMLTGKNGPMRLSRFKVCNGILTADILRMIAALMADKGELVIGVPDIAHRVFGSSAADDNLKRGLLSLSKKMRLIRVPLVFKDRADKDAFLDLVSRQATTCNMRVDCFEKHVPDATPASETTRTIVFPLWFQ